MSWFTRPMAATLSSAPSDDDDDEATSGDKSPERATHPADADAEEDEQPDSPSRGVKGDISELTESLTRRFWGVASFLAPPPAAEAAETAAGAEEVGAQSSRIAGIRSDLAEIGGRVRSGISMLSNANAVAEISKIASLFLPFGPGEKEEEGGEAVGSKIASSFLPFGAGEKEEGGEAVGVTEEVVVFVRHISTHRETWLDFPLFVNDRHADVLDGLSTKGFASMSSSTSSENVSTGTGTLPPMPPPPSYIGSPVFWIGVGVALSAAFSMAYRQISYPWRSWRQSCPLPGQVSSAASDARS